MGILNSTFELDRALRRIRPDKHIGRLEPRNVPFVTDETDPAAIGPVLLDTCVYIDNGNRRLPLGAGRLIAVGGAAHISAITAMELTYAFGRLDPSDPRTARNLAYLRDVLERVPRHRVIEATPADHAFAGVIAGTLARTQGLSSDGRKRLLLDSLIFASARRHGLTVLTANTNDFDLLQQLAPDGKVAFYRTGSRVAGAM